MTANFGFADYGIFVPGVSGLTALGNNQATAFPITRKVNHFSTVPVGTGAMLPFSAVSNVTEILILNRGVNQLLIYPAPGGQIEMLGVNQPIAVQSLGYATFLSFDAVTSTGRQWYETSGSGTPVFGSLIDNGGVLVTTDGTYPTNPTGLAAGAVWSNGGVVMVVPGVTPSPAPPLIFGTVTSTQLKTTGGGNLPLTAPSAGSLQLWNNGSIVYVA